MGDLISKNIVQDFFSNAQRFESESFLSSKKPDISFEETLKQSAQPQQPEKRANNRDTQSSPNEPCISNNREEQVAQKKESSEPETESLTSEEGASTDNVVAIAASVIDPISPDLPQPLKTEDAAHIANRRDVGSISVTQTQNKPAKVAPLADDHMMSANQRLPEETQVGNVRLPDDMQIEKGTIVKEGESSILMEQRNINLNAQENISNFTKAQANPLPQLSAQSQDSQLTQQSAYASLAVQEQRLVADKPIAAEMPIESDSTENLPVIELSSAKDEFASDHQSFDLRNNDKGADKTEEQRTELPTASINENNATSTTIKPSNNAILPSEQLLKNNTIEAEAHKANALTELNNFTGELKFTGDKLSVSFATTSKNQFDNIPHRNDQVVMSIREMLAVGKSEVSVSLYPEALGKVDVKIKFLNVGSEKVIQAIRITADKQETLNLLRSDAEFLKSEITKVVQLSEKSEMSFDLRHGQGDHRSSQDMQEQQQVLQNMANNVQQDVYERKYSGASNPRNILSEDKVDMHV